jgi:hypothetical protein
VPKNVRQEGVCAKVCAPKYERQSMCAIVCVLKYVCQVGVLLCKACKERRKEGPNFQEKGLSVRAEMRVNPNL